jgi:hypothetical protein
MVSRAEMATSPLSSIRLVARSWQRGVVRNPSSRNALATRSSARMSDAAGSCQGREERSATRGAAPATSGYRRSRRLRCGISATALRSPGDPKVLRSVRPVPDARPGERQEKIDPQARPSTTVTGFDTQMITEAVPAFLLPHSSASHASHPQDKPRSCRGPAPRPARSAEPTRTSVCWRRYRFRSRNAAASNSAKACVTT